MPTSQPAQTGTIRSAQTILLALAFGVLTFSAVTVYFRMTEEPANPEIGRLLLAVTGMLAVGEVLVYFVLRKLCFRRLAATKPAALELVRQDRLPPQLFTLTILGAALAEGVGLLGMVTLFLGGPWFALLAPALAVVLILAQLPGRERVEALVRGLPGLD